MRLKQMDKTEKTTIVRMKQKAVYMLDDVRPTEFEKGELYEVPSYVAEGMYQRGMATRQLDQTATAPSADGPKIAPIETRYRGYRFRSRLEARWAVFLDDLAIRWTYEPEGFDLGHAWYLPDFWIRLADKLQRPYPRGLPPECGFWLEIKPTLPDAAALEKCAALCALTGHCVNLAAGNIGLDEFAVWKWHPRNSTPLRSGQNCRDLDLYLLFQACPEEAQWSDLESAYETARSERFDGR